jgi:hypothetical protein
MVSSRFLRALLCSALLIGVPVGAQSRPITLAVAGRANANPSIAAQGPFVAVAWSAVTGSTTDIFVATSRDGGATFSAPAQVNATAGDARVSGEQPPRVALVAGAGAGGRTSPTMFPDVVVVWTTKGASGSRLLTGRSRDGGRTFGASTIVPGTESEGNRGWQSIAVDSTGRVLVLWLDHRETVMPATMHHQADGSTAGTAKNAPAPSPAPVVKPDPVEKANRSQLFFSALDGGTARSIARGVCYCCKTSLAVVGRDVFAVWRHVFPGNQRDIGFTVSRDGGKSFAPIARVSDDHWEFDGCPENGPAIAVDAKGRAHVAWLTLRDGKEGAPLALYHASSADGRRFGARAAIPAAGPAAHVQMSYASDGILTVAWDEIVSAQRRIGVARGRVATDGSVAFTPLALPGDRASRVYPVVGTTSVGTVLAYVRQADGASTIEVTVLPPSRPR